jgi:hypothetical protein
VTGDPSSPTATQPGLPAARPACSWAVAHATRAHLTLAAQERSGEPFRGGDETDTRCNAAQKQAFVLAWPRCLKTELYARARQAARRAGMVAGGACARRCAPEQPASVPKAMRNSSSHCCSMTRQQPARRAHGLQRTPPASTLR